MNIKDAFTALVEKITGKGCHNCKHRIFWFCRRNDEKGKRCKNGIIRRGWEKAEGKE